MSLLNPVVTCGYVNTVHTVCYVVNKSFFLHMDSCQLCFSFFSFLCFLCICACAPVLYHLVVKATGIDRYSSLSGSLPLLFFFECLCYIMCVLRRINTVSQSVMQTVLTVTIHSAVL